MTAIQLRRGRVCAAVAGMAMLSFGVMVWAGSETPPKGPPWHQNLLAAQKQALDEDKPILFYFTKTY